MSEPFFHNLPGGSTWDNWRRLAGGKFDTHSVLTDPMFEDPDKHDYRLKPNSLAFKLGFKPIDFNQIGLRPGHAYYQFAIKNEEE